MESGRNLKTAQEKREKTKKEKKAGTRCEVLGAARDPKRSSEEERRVDAKALIAEEGRDKLRKAMGSRK